MWSFLASSQAPGLETFGPLGAFAALALAFFNKAYKREADRADKLEAMVWEFLPKLVDAIGKLEDHSRRAR